MQTPAGNSPIFHLFSNLPPELRNQIWHEALPEIGPTLYFYKEECYELSMLTKSNDPEDDPDRMVVEFNLDLLDPAPVDVPLVHVNLEARSIAMAWAHKQGLKIQKFQTALPPVFVKAFDKRCDVLYIPLYNSDRHYHDAWAVNYIDNDYLWPRDTLLAFHVDLIRSEDMGYLIQGSGLESVSRTMFLVVGEPEVSQQPYKDMTTLRRWEFKSAYGRESSWITGCDDAGRDVVEPLDDEARKRLIEDADAYDTCYPNNWLDEFEFRPISTFYR